MWIDRRQALATGGGLLAWASLPARGAAQAVAPTASDQADDLVTRLRADHDLSKIWFHLARDDGGVATVARGGAQAADPVAIGSISKSVTGIGIAILLQRGDLKLDDTVGGLLTRYFEARGEEIDPSLSGVTVRRLMTHTAGLRPNFTTDPEHGIRNDRVMPRLESDEHFFRYLVVADAARSNGSSAFVYSNISFLLLGLIIEARTGRDYRDFCQQEIFGPLQIGTAYMPPRWQLIAPFSGWFMEIADVVKLWRSFHIRQTRLVKPDLLRTLIKEVAVPTDAGGEVRYVAGAFVRLSADGNTYVVSHDGVSDFQGLTPTFFAFVQMGVPGPAWAIATSPIVSRDDRRAIRREVNGYLEGQGP